MLILVCYDTPDNKRRRRLAKLLEGHGERVQESIFELYLSTGRLRKLQRRIATLIDADEDRIRYYRFCAKDILDIRHDGIGRLPMDIVDVVI